MDALREGWLNFLEVAGGMVRDGTLFFMLSVFRIAGLIVFTVHLLG